MFLNIGYKSGTFFKTSLAMSKVLYSNYSIAWSVANPPEDQEF